MFCLQSSDDEDDDDDASSDPVPLPPLTAPPARTFVDSDPSLSSLFPDYLENPSEGVSGALLIVVRILNHKE